MNQSIKFYRDGLGFETDEIADDPAIIFFNTTGTKFELFPLTELAKDISEANPPQKAGGFPGFTLAINVKTKAEVKAVVELAREAGAAIIKEPTAVFWGGYHAYFTDPDGYYWEIAWGPDFKYDEDDMLII